MSSNNPCFPDGFLEEDEIKPILPSEDSSDDDHNESSQDPDDDY